MAKHDLSLVSQRRLTLTILVLILFVIYLLFDIDFLITFDFDDVAPIQTSQIIIQSAQQSTKKQQLSDLQKYGFDRSNWHKSRLHPNHCPYFENICVHKQHFYVFEQANRFELDPKSTSTDLFGQSIQSSFKSFAIYKEIFNSRVWNKEINEYESSHCIHDPLTPNHIILSSNYNGMMGEFYLRVLTMLHYIFNSEQWMDKTDRNYKFYIVLPEFAEIFLSHKLLLEQYTKFQVQLFVDLFEHYRCKCFQRVFFCGFSRYATFESDASYYLSPQNVHRSRILGHRLKHFNDMINEYQLFINTYYVNMTQSVSQYKNSKLAQKRVSDKFGALRRQNASEWRFIAFYQRTKRRKWINISKNLRECNLRYNQFKILCIEINLEDFYHAKDIIVMHRSVTMLIGIHGATLTDAIWMENNCGNYVIELLPTNSPEWTSSLDKPTLSGILFWKSTYNYVGLKLLNTSIVYRYSDKYKNEYAWQENDFNVEPDRLMKVIDFLIIDDDGYCEKYNGKADRIQIPNELKEMGFAIYNAFCPQNQNLTHSYVKMRIID